MKKKMKLMKIKLLLILPPKDRILVVVVEKVDKVFNCFLPQTPKNNKQGCNTEKDQT